MWTVLRPFLLPKLSNPSTGEHIYTTDLNEYNVLGANGWSQEGIQGYLLDNPGAFNAVTAVPYYRLYQNSTAMHLWTKDPNEYYTLIQSSDWNNEGADGYILPSSTTGDEPLYRLSYPDGRGLHLWTTDFNEYNTLSAGGWTAEGISGYLIQ